GIASPAYVAGLHLQPRWRFAVALTWAAVAVAASALLWSTMAVLVEGDRGAVPLVFLPATIALAAGPRLPHVGWGTPVCPLQRARGRDRFLCPARHLCLRLPPCRWCIRPLAVDC